MKVPIRTRLTAWYVALLALVVGLVGAFVVVRLRSDLTDSIDNGLRPATAQIAAGYRLEGRAEVPDVAHTALAGERAAAQVLDPSARVLVAYGDVVARRPMLSAGDLRRVLSGRRLVKTSELGRGDQRFRLAAQATTRKGAARAVVAAESLAPVSRSTDRVVVLLLIAVPIGLLIAALGGWLLARRALRPVEEMTTRAAGIGVERLEDRLTVPATGDELARLAETLNTMLARIERGVHDQRRLIADTSHELRSPLAAMRSELDVSLRADDLDQPARRVLESIRDDVDRMTRTVDGLLTLARADEGRLDLLLEPVDLNALARATASSLEELGRARGVAIEVSGDGAIALGDTERLRQALHNLVDNAVKFSPDGATVRLQSWTAAGEVGVNIEDDGPGVPGDQRERIFDRFFRADVARTPGAGGSGIGLSIVREVAAAHGGRAWVESRSQRGSRFVLALPRSQS